MDRTATFTKKKTSGHEPQLGLETKTDRLTDRQLQHDFDSDFEFDLMLSYWKLHMLCEQYDQFWKAKYVLWEICSVIGS
jgi:hypothetical protein